MRVIAWGLWFLQALLEYSKWVGLDLGQAGYQAMAAGCVEKRSASVLLEKMAVRRCGIWYRVIKMEACINKAISMWTDFKH